MLFHARPYSHPLNWCPHEVAGSVNLLSAYVQDIEAQVCKGIRDYQTNAETEVVEPEHPDDHGRIITHHRGLDDETWNLKSIFEEYFPNLQRRSALITLFSFFEHELDKLCKRVQVQSDYKLDLADIREQGILRSTTYLIKVAGMDGIRSPVEWQEIRQIQSVRNQIVHSDGKLPEPSDGRRAKLAEYVAASKHLSVTSDDEIAILSGYLSHCLAVFESYFKQIHASLQRKYEASQETSVK
jgi:hypothetical protein